MTKKYSKKYITDFHKNYKGEYKGAVTSGYIAKRIKKYLGEDVLDAGAGDGTLVKEIKKRYGNRVKVVGVDLVPKDKIVKQGDLTNLQFKDSSFDCIVTMDVIEHISAADLKKTIKEFARVIRLGGRVIITTKYKEDLESNRVTCPECGFHFHRVGHQQTFDQPRLDGLMSKGGFICEEFAVHNLTLLGKVGWLADIFYMLPFTKFLLQKFRLNGILKNDLYAVYTSYTKD